MGRFCIEFSCITIVVQLNIKINLVIKPPNSIIIIVLDDICGEVTYVVKTLRATPFVLRFMTDFFVFCYKKLKW